MPGTESEHRRRTGPGPAPGWAVPAPRRSSAGEGVLLDGDPRDTSPSVEALVVHLRSGGTDLHGGLDRLDLVLETRRPAGAGSPERSGRVDRTVVAGVERGRWWLDHSEHAVRLTLARPTPADDLVALEVVAHLRGGPADRAWELEAASVEDADGTFRVRAQGRPLHRFTLGRGSAYRLPLHVIGS